MIVLDPSVFTNPTADFAFWTGVPPTLPPLDTAPPAAPPDGGVDGSGNANTGTLSATGARVMGLVVVGTAMILLGLGVRRVRVRIRPVPPVN